MTHFFKKMSCTASEACRTDFSMHYAPSSVMLHRVVTPCVVQMLPYWDWSELYNIDCLVNNPLYEEKERERPEDYCQVSGGGAASA